MGKAVTLDLAKSYPPSGYEEEDIPITFSELERVKNLRRTFSNKNIKASEFDNLYLEKLKFFIKRSKK